MITSKQLIKFLENEGYIVYPFEEPMYENKVVSVTIDGEQNKSSLYSFGADLMFCACQVGRYPEFDDTQLEFNAQYLISLNVEEETYIGSKMRVFYFPDMMWVEK